MTSSLPAIAVSDADLIDRVRRAGSASPEGAAAYADLVVRHRTSALRYAETLVDPERAETLVRAVTAGIARVIDAGGGPDLAFRPYLLGSMRRSVAARTVTAPFEPAAAMTDAPGFAALPGRWQLAVWHGVIEQEPAAATGALLGVPTADVEATVADALDALDDPTDVRRPLAAAVLGPTATAYLPADEPSRSGSRSRSRSRFESTSALVRRHPSVVAGGSVAALLAAVVLGVGAIGPGSSAPASRTHAEQRSDGSLPTGPGRTLTPRPSTGSTGQHARHQRVSRGATGVTATRTPSPTASPTPAQAATSASPDPTADVAVSGSRSGDTVTWRASGVPSGSQTTLVASAGNGVTLRTSHADCTGSGTDRITCTVTDGSGAISVYGLLVDTTVRLDVHAVSGRTDPDSGNNHAVVR